MADQGSSSAVTGENGVNEVVPWKLKVDVTSDVICPFCLIGVKQLLIALDNFKLSHPDRPLVLDIRLLPYQLNASLTETPQSRKETGVQKFGEERWKLISAQLLEKFKAVGVEGNMDGQTSSSHLAHRLQTYVLLHNPTHQLPLALSIFDAFHVNGQHPSDKTLLSDLAVQHKIFESKEKAMAFLDGDECDAEVRRGYTTAHRLGVTGVPFFLFQDRYAASGAMGVEEFGNIFEEILKREKSEIKPQAAPSAEASSSSS